MAHNPTFLAAWREPADATDTGILTSLAMRATVDDRELLHLVAWRLATLLDRQTGATSGESSVRAGLTRWFVPPEQVWPRR